MDDDKVEIQNQVETDPEVLAEVKKNKLLHLKLERWKDTANAVGVVLQTFKAEAMSLTSGVGTLVVGWFQIKKWVAKGRAEVKAEGRVEGNAEGRIAGRAAERAERREDRREATMSSKPRIETMIPVPMATAEITAAMPVSSFFLDPMSYITVVVPVIFVWSSAVAWIKRKRKQALQGGRRNGN